MSYQEICFFSNRPALKWKAHVRKTNMCKLIIGTTAYEVRKQKINLPFDTEFISSF